jgi:hypothetical protein
VNERKSKTRMLACGLNQPPALIRISDFGLSPSPFSLRGEAKFSNAPGMKSLLARALLLLAVLGLELCAQPGATNLPFQFQKNVLIPMRDGTQLAANLFLPKEGGPFPVILQRTPYGKMDEKAGMPKSYCARGYVIVAQDCRGRGGSQGRWDPFRHEADDGFDTRSAPRAARMSAGPSGPPRRAAPSI